MRKKNKNSKGKMLNLVNFCNSQISNTTDFMIAKAILKMVENNEMVSLEELSENAAVSQASLHRFIRKAGFSSYEDFKTCFLNAVLEMNIDRKKMHRETFGNATDINSIVDILYQNGMSNLQETLRKLDYRQLKRVSTMLHNATDVTILGSERELATFYTLQLDLLGEGTACNMFYSHELQKRHVEQLPEGTIVLVINVFTDWFKEDLRVKLEELHAEHRIQTIGLFQEDDEKLRTMFDEYIFYGEPDSHNQGYYSLTLLSQVLSELLYE